MFRTFTIQTVFTAKTHINITPAGVHTRTTRPLRRTNSECNLSDLIWRKKKKKDAFWAHDCWIRTDVNTTSWRNHSLNQTLRIRPWDLGLHCVDCSQIVKALTFAKRNAFPWDTKHGIKQNVITGSTYTYRWQKCSLKETQFASKSPKKKSKSG